MSLKSHILRRSDALPAGRDVHHECRAAAVSLDAAYQATIARLLHTIDTQTRWIDYQDAQIATLKTLAGVPAETDVTPWTDADRARSRALDALTLRIESGRDGLLIRTWLRLRRRRLERIAMEGER